MFQLSDNPAAPDERVRCTGHFQPGAFRCSSVSLAGKDLLNDSQQRLKPDGFSEKMIRAHLHAFDRQFNGATTSQYDAGAVWVQCFQPGYEIERVSIRQRIVEQDEIGGERFRSFENSRRTLLPGNLEAIYLQKGLDGLPKGFVFRE